MARLNPQGTARLGVFSDTSKGAQVKVFFQEKVSKGSVIHTESLAVCKGLELALSRENNRRLPLLLSSSPFQQNNTVSHGFIFGDLPPAFGSVVQARVPANSGLWIRSPAFSSLRSLEILPQISLLLPSPSPLPLLSDSAAPSPLPLLPLPPTPSCCKQNAAGSTDAPPSPLSPRDSGVSPGSLVDSSGFQAWRKIGLRRFSPIRRIPAFQQIPPSSLAATAAPSPLQLLPLPLTPSCYKQNAAGSTDAPPSPLSPRDSGVSADSLVDSDGFQSRLRLDPWFLSQIFMEIRRQSRLYRLLRWKLGVNQDVDLALHQMLLPIIRKRNQMVILPLLFPSLHPSKPSFSLLPPFPFFSNPRLCLS